MTVRRYLYTFIKGITPATIDRISTVIAFFIRVCIEFVRILIVVALCLLYLRSCEPAFAAVSIPRAANQHKRELTRVAHLEFGLLAPVALLAAQIHVESRWNTRAVSPVGAQGLAQFMPATARWLPTIAPNTGQPLPFNSAWSLRALCVYNKYHLGLIKNTASLRQQWAFALCAYNGGLGWVQRDRKLAQQRGLNPAVYFGSVEGVNAGRRASAFTENRRYPKQIFEAMPAYEAAGWGAGVHDD